MEKQRERENLTKARSWKRILPDLERNDNENYRRSKNLSEQEEGSIVTKTPPTPSH